MDTKYVKGLEKANSEIRAIDFSCLRLWFGAVLKKVSIFISPCLRTCYLVSKEGSQFSRKQRPPPSKLNEGHLTAVHSETSSRVCSILMHPVTLIAAGHFSM